MEQDILKSLNQLAELAVDSGYADERDWNNIGDVKFYFAPSKKKFAFDKDYFSFDFRGLELAFYENKIESFNCESLEGYNMNLYAWVGELREALTEGIAVLTEQKHNDLVEAQATGN